MGIESTRPVRRKASQQTSLFDHDSEDYDSAEKMECTSADSDTFCQKRRPLDPDLIMVSLSRSNSCANFIEKFQNTKRHPYHQITTADLSSNMLYQLPSTTMYDIMPFFKDYEVMNLSDNAFGEDGNLLIRILRLMLNFQELHMLDLSGNALCLLSDQNFLTSLSFLARFPVLTTLNLSNNGFSYDKKAIIRLYFCEPRVINLIL